jgi:flavin-dependent dehydrogenase
VTYDADVLIAGGGPAGLASAINARQQGLSVIVAEPRNNPIDKACGEGLMPGGLAELASLGVDPAGMPLRGIAYLNEHRRAEAPFRGGPGCGVRRTTLHAALASRAKEQDTEWISTRVTSVDQDAHGVAAAGIRAKWLIAADGLHSTVRRAIGINAVPGRPRRYGVRWHYQVPAWSDFVEVHWSRWGEAYVTPVPARHAIVPACTLLTCGIPARGADFGTLTLAFPPPRRPTAGGAACPICCTYFQ